jgi:hypothetical protein
LELLVFVGDDIHFAALARARSVGVVSTLPTTGLAGLHNADVMAWITRIWDGIEAALSSARQAGAAATEDLIQTVYSSLDELSAAMKKQAREVQAAISERINVYLHEAIDGALQRVRPTITIGGQEFRMKSVAVEQKVKLSCNIKASLAEICAFLAEGELTLKAEYGTA